MTDERKQFAEALAEREVAFGVALDARARALLADYFELVRRWNPRLHLVAPCTPAEFAARHVLESLAAAAQAGAGARLIDVGSGAGLPAIPCLIARPDLSATLVEASTKKSVFLREAVAALGLKERARVVNSRFEATDAPDAEFVTCRAIERFTETLPALLAWSPHAATLLLFGGPSLREAIERAGRGFESVLIPESEQRFLFVVRPA